jgi:hypothetical protein
VNKVKICSATNHLPGVQNRRIAKDCRERHLKSVFRAFSGSSCTLSTVKICRRQKGTVQMSTSGVSSVPSAGVVQLQFLQKNQGSLKMCFPS